MTVQRPGEIAVQGGGQDDQPSRRRHGQPVKGLDSASARIGQLALLGAPRRG
jgi:hypothetical protein